MAVAHVPQDPGQAYVFASVQGEAKLWRRDGADAAFEAIAAAEAEIHGTTADRVHLHEVGAVDAIVDVIGVCSGFLALRLDRLTVSPVALGGGSVASAHGTLPVPGPAVLQLLSASTLTAHGGPVERELATPTGVTLLAELADGTGGMPEMRVSGVGVGAGGRDDAARANVVRLVVGEPAEPVARWLLLETNVDDLDPRVWPVVIQRLLTAGAADAWLTPIVMKKGRPALSLSALVSADRLDAVQRCVFTETTAIGVRTVDVGRRALDREWVTVDVDGQPVRVKLARLDGEVVNAVPEFVDVTKAAETLARPVKIVLAAATAAAEHLAATARGGSGS
jgi:uncharacterized protein (TIGR00299 family) protein